MAQTNDVLRCLNENMLDACERVEAGFYFEEGGCYGMAVALFESLERIGFVPAYGYSEEQGHAMVLVDDDVLDYTGICRRPHDLRIVSLVELQAIALAGGTDSDKLFSDQCWASEAIKVALA